MAGLIKCFELFTKYKINFGPYIMQRCNEIRVNVRVEVEVCRFIPSEINIAYILSGGVSFGKFHLLSTWFTGPEFLASNNQDYDFEGVKEETLCDEVLIKTVEDQESNVNVSAFSHPEGHVTMHNFLTPL